VTKPDSTVKSLVVAAIRRHSSDMKAWVDTRLWDEADPAHRARFADVALQDGELPILYSVVTPDDWTMFTSRAVEFAHHGVRGRVPLEAVEDVRAGNFKGYARQESEHLALHARDGTVFQCPYRTGHESMGSLYAINTLLHVGRGGRTSGCS